jgi:hypothetical protein
MSDMTKKKTSINIDDELWQQWLIYVLKKYGSSHKVSECLAEAIQEYMNNHPIS